MALFNESEVLSENQHEQYDIAALEIGESIAFYFANTRSATSEEYGDFIICQGLKVNLEATTADELVESGSPVSFIPNTLLVNKINDNAMVEGELYRVEKAWDKGQKFSDGKKAKGWGYKVFHLAADPKIKAGLLKAYKSAVNGVVLEETETGAAEKPGK